MQSDATSPVPLCTRCNYSLAGLPDDAPCPECSLARPAIADFLFCPHCGYHLVGLKPDAACPECGKPVADALADFPISRAGAAYIRRLASGSSLLLTAAYISVAAFLLLPGFAMILPLTLRAAGQSARSVDNLGAFLIVMLVFFAAQLASSIIWFVGWIRATTPDPVYKHHAPTHGPRSATRGLAIAVFCLQFGIIVPFVNLVVWIALPICAAIMFFTATAYIRALARRIPSPKLERSVRKIRTAGGITIALLTALIILSILDGFFGNADLAGYGTLASFILTLVLLLIYLRLISRFAKAMKQTRRRAIDAQLPARLA